MINQKIILKNETTYRFGGMCKNFFLLEDKKDLDNFDEYDIFDEYFILGKGSNVAFSENEFDEAVIQSKINYINFFKAILLWLILFFSKLVISPKVFL